MNIQTWQDLLKFGVRFVNREHGSGVRVLLDEKLRVNNIDRDQINGYVREEMSHLAVASCVARGEADVGKGHRKGLAASERTGLCSSAKRTLRSGDPPRGC